MKTRRLKVLVIGSGAAGLAAAIRLDALGVRDIAVYTEGLNMGTSINTGSDKQTYYKLGMYGAEQDSPASMARDLMAGGSMHGDLALVEAALSQQAFAHLANLGVPFPHDRFGQYPGYKTDHDPKRRATSCGPGTSRDMCAALIRELHRRQIEVCEKRILAALSTDNGRCSGALFVNTEAASSEDAFERVDASYTVFAVGGPGGLYEQSVYPAVHTGAIGTALAAGAKARNLPESQFGLASVAFRWNVSGSYMQVLPRFVSVDADGAEREFLREYFDSPREMYDMIFLKGYQWPFSAGNIPGSSLIDILVHRETVVRGRRVFLDYRSDPADFDFSSFSRETRSYLEKSGAVADTPFQRLKPLNEPAIELYRRHSIDLETDMLEVAVCAQHNNGGLAADLWWESENIRFLFPVGEVNGSHGVTRPGGSALNAGQCGAFRAAEKIAAYEKYAPAGTPDAASSFEPIVSRLAKASILDWRKERSAFQKRMSADAAFLREKKRLETALAEAETQWKTHTKNGLGGISPREVAEQLRNEQLLAAQVCYLSAILSQIGSGTGSRGGAIVLADDGKPIHPLLPWKTVPEDRTFRSRVLETRMENGRVISEWTPCRPLPETDEWFENVWSSFRKGNIYE